MARDKYVLNDIIKLDSKSLSQYVKPNSVALTVTSPPYRNAINYSKHVKNLKGNKNSRFRGDVGLKTSEYLEEMKKIFSEVNKVTTPGGFCCIIIGDEVENGTLVPLPSLLISNLVNEDDPDEGWHLREMIIWNKITAGRNGSGNRFGIFVQQPMPTYFRTNIMHEYIIVLQKGKKSRLEKGTANDRIPLNRAMKRQVALSIWDITPVPPKVIQHPAVFPEQIPWRLIKLYSKTGDTILDPMNGSGQTTKIAKKLGRNYIGIDKRIEYVKLAKKRLNERISPSNFMVPVYLPIKWSKVDESGKKDDAHLDVPKVPKGYKLEFNAPSAKEVLGMRGNYMYYRNSDGEYLCYIIGRTGKPTTRIKLGRLSSSKSPLQIALKRLPYTPFHKAKLNKILPQRFVENRQPVKAIIDVLEYEKKIKKTGEKYRTSELYVKIPRIQKKSSKRIAKMIPA